MKKFAELCLAIAALAAAVHFLAPKATGTIREGDRVVQVLPSNAAPGANGYAVFTENGAVYHVSISFRADGSVQNTIDTKYLGETGSEVVTK